jgi:hypothetical protein
MLDRRRTLPLLSLLVLAATPLAAGVSVSFDIETLNEVLPALSASEITVPLSEDRSLAVRLAEMQVTGLDPTAGGEGGNGHILTSMRLQVPSLGVNLPIEPILSLHVVEGSGGSELEMRFERVSLALPLAKAIDVSPLLPPLRFPAENLWLVAGAEGNNVRVKSRLSAIEMGRKVVRFEINLEALNGK